MIDKLSGEDILAMQHLRRWHMVRVRREQTLAEHSGTVAMLAFKLARLWQPGLGWVEHAILLDRALAHDAHEVEYGDMPGIVKRVLPDYDEKSAAEFWKKRGMKSLDVHSDFALLEQAVKLADKFEGYLFYVLEGEDPRLREGIWEKVQELLRPAPLAVKHFCYDLASKAINGTFTPQPGSQVSPLEKMEMNAKYGKVCPCCQGSWDGVHCKICDKGVGEGAEEPTHSYDVKSAYPASPNLPEKVLMHEHSTSIEEATVVRGKLHNCQKAEEQIGLLESRQLDFLQRDIGKWADQVFPDRTPHGTLSKLVLEEIPEFLFKLKNGEQDAGEYADLLVLILDVAYQRGINCEEAVIEKMRVNRARTWKKGENGTYQHVEEPAVEVIRRSETSSKEE